MTLAEHWFGQARGLNDFLVVSVEHSLGLGIIHNGELFRGANGLSPDLGDLMVRPPGSGGGRLAGSPRRPRSSPKRGGLRGAEHEAAFRARPRHGAGAERAAAGDQRCIGMLAAAGEALGFAIANLITLFAPPKVHLAGRPMATSAAFPRAAARDRRGADAGRASPTSPKSSCTNGATKSGRAARRR